MINISFTQEQMNMLALAIAELPHKYAVPLITHINQQIEAAKRAQETSSVDFKHEPTD